MKTFLNATVLAFAWAVMPITAAAQGYQVQPMLATLAPSGANTRMTLSIKNTGAVPISVEITPFRATVDEAGTPTRTDEDKDLLVFPPQASVEPGKEQSVQVRYIGDPALAQARMYGVRVSQLPVSAAALTGGSGAATDVKVGFNFLSHIVVSPGGARAPLTIVETGRAANGDLLLRITNTGDGIALPGDAGYTLVDGGGKTVKLAPDHMRIGNFSAFMPKQARRATVASADVAGLTGPVKATLSSQ